MRALGEGYWNKPVTRGSEKCFLSGVHMAEPEELTWDPRLGHAGDEEPGEESDEDGGDEEDEESEGQEEEVESHLINGTEGLPESSPMQL